MPADIAPLLVLDASVRVRTVYDLWQRKRGGITILPSAAKRYDNHTIHVWNTSGGKSAFKKDRGLLLEGIVTAIREKPHEEWLIIHHKNTPGHEFASEVRALLPGDDIKTHFLHWGTHDATNHFSHVPNVILAGTLFCRTSHYEAMGRLASGHPSKHGSYPEADTKEVTLGEHRNLVLQALCRGAVRRCEEGGCPRTDTYIIASRRSGIQASLTDIFPGAKVVTWKPVLRDLTGKVAEAFAYIEARLAFDPSALVSFAQVMTAIDWTDAKDFKRSIRRHEDFIDALEEAGIKEGGGRSRMTGFQLVLSAAE